MGLGGKSYSAKKLLDAQFRSDQDRVKRLHNALRTTAKSVVQSRASVKTLTEGFDSVGVSYFDLAQCLDERACIISEDDQAARAAEGNRAAMQRRPTVNTRDTKAQYRIAERFAAETKAYKEGTPFQRYMDEVSRFVLQPIQELIDRCKEAMDSGKALSASHKAFLKAKDDVERKEKKYAKGVKSLADSKQYGIQRDRQEVCQEKYDTRKQAFYQLYNDIINRNMELNGPILEHFFQINTNALNSLVTILSIPRAGVKAGFGHPTVSTPVVTGSSPISANGELPRVVPKPLNPLKEHDDGSEEENTPRTTRGVYRAA